MFMDIAREPVDGAESFMVAAHPLILAHMLLTRKYVPQLETFSASSLLV